MKYQQLEDLFSKQQHELLKFLINKEHSQHEGTQTTPIFVIDSDLHVVDHNRQVHIDPVAEVSVSKALLNSELTLTHLELTATRNELWRSDENLKRQLDAKTKLLRDLQDTLTATKADLSQSKYESEELSLQIEFYKQLLTIEERNHTQEQSKLEYQLNESIAVIVQQQQTIQEANTREEEFAQCRLILSEELNLNRKEVESYFYRCTQQRSLIHEQNLALNHARAALMGQKDEMGALSQHVTAMLVDNLTPEGTVESSQISFNGQRMYKFTDLLQSEKKCSDSSSELWKWQDHLIQLSLELHEAIAFAIAHSRKLFLSSKSAAQDITGQSAMLADLSQLHYDLHAVIISAPWTNNAINIAVPEILHSCELTDSQLNLLYAEVNANKNVITEVRF